MRLVFAVIAALFVSVASGAQEPDPRAAAAPHTGTTWRPAAAPEGGVSWELLSTTIENEVELEDGTWILPEFPEPVAALDQTTIRIAGFMMPLQNSEKQSHFLLMAYPPDCPFCMSAGPRYLMEVFTEDAIPFSYNSLTVSGRLELLEKDETGLYFRLQGATLVDAKKIDG